LDVACYQLSEEEELAVTEEVTFPVEEII